LLCGGGGKTDVIVAAEGGLIIGHAMAVHSTRPDGIRVADVGMVVADEWQGRGVGSALLRILIGRAHARGAMVAVLDVLAENRRVLAIIGRRWPDACYDRSADAVTIQARLPSTQETRLPSTQEKGPHRDATRQAGQHQAAPVPVGRSRHLRRCGA
jgi:Acetyltransferase (GNAT) family